jgi:hypothetical protein
MDKKKIAARLRVILDRADIDSDLMTRKQSHLHKDEIEVLLDHVAILVTYLRFDADATRSELFTARNLLEE